MDKELLVMLVGARTGATYEWDQHVSISQALGVTPEQIIAISRGLTADTGLFTSKQCALLAMGEAVLKDGAASGVCVNQALLHYSETEACDALIVLGFYSMVATYMRTLQFPCDPQTDGSWIKK